MSEEGRGLISDMLRGEVEGVVCVCWGVCVCVWWWWGVLP